MSPSGDQFRDSDFHAYADGVLPPQRRSQIIAFLAANPAQTQKIMGWQMQNALLRASFPVLPATRGSVPLRERDSNLIEMVPGITVAVPANAGGLALPRQGGPLHSSQMQPANYPAPALRRRTNMGSAYVAAAGMCLAGMTVLLAALHFGALSPESARKSGQTRMAGVVPGPATDGYADGLLRRASEAHGIFAQDRDAPVEFAGQASVRLQAYLARRTGADVHAPNLLAQGLHLLGGRVLPLPEGVAAMLVYEGTDGQRFGLSIARVAVAGDGGLQFHYAESAAIHAVRWAAGDEAYVLTGEASRADLLALARLAASGVEAARGAGQEAAQP